MNSIQWLANTPVFIMRSVTDTVLRWLLFEFFVMEVDAIFSAQQPAATQYVALKAIKRRGEGWEQLA